MEGLGNKLTMVCRLDWEHVLLDSFHGKIIFSNHHEEISGFKHFIQWISLSTQKTFSFISFGTEISIAWYQGLMVHWRTVHKTAIACKSFWPSHEWCKLQHIQYCVCCGSCPLWDASRTSSKAANGLWGNEAILPLAGNLSSTGWCALLSKSFPKHSNCVPNV